MHNDNCTVPIHHNTTAICTEAVEEHSLHDFLVLFAHAERLLNKGCRAGPSHSRKECVDTEEAKTLTINNGSHRQVCVCDDLPEAFSEVSIAHRLSERS